MGSSKKQTVGYKYYLGEHLIFTHGPTDALMRITFDGNRIAWRGLIEAEGLGSIFAPTLFGGEDIGREGGVKGTFSYCPGEPTQGQNAYLLARLGNPLPAFRGVSALVFQQMYLGTSAYLKKVAARLQRIHKSTNGATQWYDEKAAIPSPIFGGSVTTINLNAVTNGGVDTAAGLLVGVEFTANPDDVIVIKPDLTSPTFIAWSPWGVPSPANAPGHTGSVARYNVIRDGVSDSSYGATGTFNGYANARQAYLDQYPLGITLTGSSSYVFYIQDTPVGDNSGGMSLEVTVAAQFDMNPAHIIRECLTDTLWGMGYNAADIDDTAFAAAADQLYSEGMGVSILWDQQMPIEQFIKEIIKHIDASLYVHRSTGKFVLKLIRGDYDLMSLPLFDESNVDKVEGFQRPSFGELTNSVTVNYWDASTAQKGSVTLEDPALILMQGATINTTLQYPGFTNSDIVGRVALRDLKTLSNPLASCTIYADSDAEPLSIGDVFRFSWAEYGIANMPMRISAIAYGDGLSNKVKMQVVQDVFALPDSVIVTPPDQSWEDPNEPPVASEHQVAIELPYVELLQQLGLSTVEATLTTNPEVGYAGIAVSRPGDGAINARMMIDSGAGYEEVGLIDFCPIAILDEDIDQIQTTFAIADGIDLSLALDLGVVGSWCQIGDELMIVVALDETEIEVERGTLDTTPAPHTTGDAIFFWDNFAQNDDEQYVLSDALNIKALTITGQGQLDIADAPAQPLTIVARAAKPYPPGNLKIDTVAYPTGTIDFDFDITWSHRNRLTQGDVLVATTETDITPEAGTTYTVRLYLNDVLEHEYTGITDNFKNDVALPGNGTARVEVWSVRDSIESFQPLWAEFPYEGAVLLTDDIGDWSLGNAFSQTASFVGGVAPYTWSITAGALPDGLTLNTSTGQISGTPTVAGVFTYTLRITDTNALFDEKAVTQEVFDDADWLNVQFLIPFDGANAATAATDVGPDARAITFQGNAQLTTANKKWGTAALELDGTGDYVTLADAADLRVGSGDFAIDGWFRSDSSAAAQTIINKRDAAGAEEFSLAINGTALTCSFSLFNSSAVYNGSGSFSALNVWHYFRAVRKGSTCYWFVGPENGTATLLDTANQSGAPATNTQPVQIGRDGFNTARDFNGQLDGIRFTKGTHVNRLPAVPASGFASPPYPHPIGVYYVMSTEAGEQEVTEEGSVNVKENPLNV